MTTTVCIPLLSMSMSEGKIIEWFVPDGGSATEGQPLYALESEKAVVDIDAPASGIVRHKAEAGDTLPVGAEIADIE